MRLLLATTAATLALASPAAATIVVGKGMAGIAVGMKEVRVIEILGAPDSARTRSDDFGRHRQLTYSSQGGLRIVLRRGATGAYEVFSIRTRRGVERTSSGVGVGSSERSLKRK